MTETKQIIVIERNDKSHDSKGGLTETSAPVVHVKNLQKFVKDLLDGYKQNGKLLWRDGMPKDEIWVKIGGDHGGNSFKLCLQVCNLDKPNSKENTIVYACMSAKDIYENMSKICSIHESQINQLKEEYWENKRIRLFVYGDYAFLASLYGLSGARGKHFCLWCNIRYGDLQIPLDCRGLIRARKLGRMIKDYENFKKDGKQNLSLASSFNNVIHRPMWDVKVKHVCPPYLHMLLGIVKKHHDLLENELHQIDLQIAEDISLSKAKLDNSLFHQNIKGLREKRKLLNSVGFLRDERDEENSNLTEKEAKKLQTRIDSIELKLVKCKPSLQVQSGPVISAVQITLKHHNIVQQAYHSKSFVGNHCSKYLKSNIQDDIWCTILEKVCELSGKPDINDRAKQTASKFLKFNQYFSDIHTKVGHMNKISQDMLPDIKISIENYLKYYRQYFPNLLIPKHHFLEDHVIDWISKWGFGMGLHGEQGGETCFLSSSF